MKKIQKATDTVTVELTAKNARKLQELVALTHHDDPAQFVNMMLQEEMDNYLEAWTGNLHDLVNGWTYHSAAEARAVAKKINTWCERNGGNGLPLRTKGKKIVTLSDAEENAAWQRRHGKRVA